MHKRTTIGLLLCLLVLGLVVSNALLSNQRTSPIVKATYGQYQVEIMENSPTLSQAIAINQHGSIIGSREVPDESGNIFRVLYFYCGPSDCQDMPLPAGYTNVEAEAISDNELVVGFASRPIGHAEGSLRAVVWSPAEKSIELLPAADGDLSSHAQSISGDGKLIAGYSTGPDRLRPVVWSRPEPGQAWEVQVLPTVMEYNPYLMSSSLLISGDGTIVAGCCTEQILAGDVHDSSLYRWRRSEGEWRRELIHEEQLYLRGLNNRGDIVGSVRSGEVRLPCYVSAEGSLRLLDLLPGDRAGEAWGINDHSQIVGWSDNPHNPAGYPRACRWTVEGQVTAIELTERAHVMVYAINNAGQLAGMLTALPEGDQTEEAESQAAELSLAFRTLNRVGPGD